MILLGRKTGYFSIRPTWISKELLNELKCKRRAHRQWRQGKTSKEEYRTITWVLGDEIMKTKANKEQRERETGNLSKMSRWESF